MFSSMFQIGTSETSERHHNSHIHLLYCLLFKCQHANVNRSKRYSLTEPLKVLIFMFNDHVSVLFTHFCHFLNQPMGKDIKHSNQIDKLKKHEQKKTQAGPVLMSSLRRNVLIKHFYCTVFQQELTSCQRNHILKYYCKVFYYEFVLFWYFPFYDLIVHQILHEYSCWPCMTTNALLHEYTVSACTYLPMCSGCISNMPAGTDPGFS